MPVKVFLVLKLPDSKDDVYYEVTINDNRYSSEYVIYKINKAIDDGDIKNISELIEFLYITFDKKSMVSCINKKVLKKQIA